MDNIEKDFQKSEQSRAREAELDAQIESLEKVALMDDKIQGIGSSLNDKTQRSLKSFRVLKSSGGEGENEELVVAHEEYIRESLRYG